MEPPDSTVIRLTPGARAAAEDFGTNHSRELLTIVFTDLVGSTRLQSLLGNLEASRLNDLHRRIVRETLAPFEAREIEWAGDSCLSVFTKPSDAVTFAVRMLQEHRRARDSEPNLPNVRTGIHMGEILVRKHGRGKNAEDLFGVQVSEAARILSLAGPNQILCSRAVYDNARSALRGTDISHMGPLVWHEHGRYEFAGVLDPMEICEVGESEFAPLKSPTESEKCRRAQAEGARAIRATGRNWAVAASAMLVLVLGAALYVAYVISGGTSMENAGPGETAYGPPEAMSRPIRRDTMGLRPEHPLIGPEFGSTDLAISPDGTQVVYVALVDGVRVLIVRPLDKLDSRVLYGTEGGAAPFFSPDGRNIAYFSDDRLRRVDLAAGSSRTVTQASFAVRGCWTGDGRILFTPRLGAGLHQVSAEGGPVNPVTELRPGDTVHVLPSVLSDGTTLLYTAATAPNIASCRVMVRSLTNGTEYELAGGAVGAKIAPTGHVIYAQQGRLAAQAFDVQTIRPMGQPVTVAEEYMAEPDTLPYSFDFSSEGTLVYVRGGGPPSLTFDLTWVDPAGGEQRIAIPAEGIADAPRISPDGRYVACALTTPETGTDIWMYDLQRSTLQRITHDAAIDVTPCWLPDGRIAYSSNFAGPIFDVYVVSPMSTSPPERITRGQHNIFASNAAPDGRSIFVSSQTSETGYDVAVVSLEEEADPQILVQTPSNEGNAMLSADGKCLAFASAESGNTEILAVTYPSLDSKIQVSTNGGRDPCWSPDGSELYYREGNKMIAVKMETEPELRAGTPRVLFEREFRVDPAMSRTYDVSPSDGRFLITQWSTSQSAASRPEIVVVTNWFEELKRLHAVRATP